MGHILFEVLGNPKAQKAHQTGKFSTYDPSDSDKADFLALCHANAPERPIEGPALLYVVFWMPIPKGVSQKKVREMRLSFYEGMTPLEISVFLNRQGLDGAPPSFHIKRPDADNFLKLINDAAKTVYWKDDSQVQIGGAFKIYSHRPRTEIEIIY